MKAIRSSLFVFFSTALLACGPGSGSGNALGGAGGSAGSSSGGAGGLGGAPGAGGGASGGAGGGASGGAGSGGVAGSGPSCAPGLGTGFAPAPEAFALPAPRCNRSFDAFGSNASALSFGLSDLGADGMPDLVVFGDECDPAVGEQRWDVYADTGSGFASMPSAYALPAPRCNTEWDQAGMDFGSLRYGLLDLASDGRPDLVVFGDACDGALGDERWDVYVGGANGFAPTPTSYALPASRCNTSWDSASKEGASLRYALIDLTLDQRPDLVVFHDACDAAVGAQRWDVYVASTDGFSPTPSQYLLPAVRCAVPWDTDAKFGTALSYGLLDLDADERPDLVVFRDACDPALGAQRWDVYSGAANAFAAAPSAYALPAARCNVAFDAQSATLAVQFGLVDLSCDRRPDLVLFRDDCEPAVGTERWDVYTAGPSGFSIAPASYQVPAPRCSASFASAAASGNTEYGLLDLSGDGRPALVVTRDNCDAIVGAKHWDVYRPH